MSREIKLIPVVVGILKRDNKLLVAQRPDDKPYSGYWEFPGGKIETNETGKEALGRELFEELDIQVQDSRLMFTHEHAYPDKTVLLEIWLVDKFAGEPHSKENQPLRWVTWQEMLALRLLEGNWPIIEKIKSLL